MHMQSAYPIYKLLHNALLHQRGFIFSLFVSQQDISETRVQNNTPRQARRPASTAHKYRTLIHLILKFWGVLHLKVLVKVQSFKRAVPNSNLLEEKGYVHSSLHPFHSVSQHLFVILIMPLSFSLWSGTN